MIENAIILAVIVFFIKATTWKGHIFEQVDTFFQIVLTKDNWRSGSGPNKKNPMKIYKPIIGCNLCMTPWWGFAIYTLGHYKHIPGFEVYEFWRIIFTLFIAGGFAAVLLLLNKLVQNIKELSENSYQ